MMERNTVTDRAFYFTRKSAPPTVYASWLVSGVVMAKDTGDAEKKLDALLKKQLRRENGSDFAFADLSNVEQPDHGVVAITIGRA